MEQPIEYDTSAPGVVPARPPSPTEDPAAPGLSPLGRYLRKLRFKMGLSMAEVHRRSGVTAGAVSLVERGDREPTRDTMTRLRAAFAGHEDAVEVAAGFLPYWLVMAMDEGYVHPDGVAFLLREAVDIELPFDVNDPPPPVLRPVNVARDPGRVVEVIEPEVTTNGPVPPEPTEGEEPVPDEAASPAE